MKEKFLALAEEVKQAGIAEAMYKASNIEELEEVWQEFLDENQELITKIEFWRDEYKESKYGAIFAEGEEIQNPMEIAIIICIMSDLSSSECDLFEDSSDLEDAIQNIGNHFTGILVEMLTTTLIYGITAEDLFPEG